MRRAARSHAAKSGHAKTRRQRMRDYQECTRQATDCEFDSTVHQETSISVSTSPTWRLSGGGIVSTALSSRKDPFDSTCRTLSLFEHRLFDHCMHFPTMSLPPSVAQRSRIAQITSRHSDCRPIRDAPQPPIHKPRVIQTQYRDTMGSHGQGRSRHAMWSHALCLPQSLHLDIGSTVL